MDFLRHGNFTANIETDVAKLGWPPYTEHLLSRLEMENKQNKQVNCIIGLIVTGMGM